jgi:hypothetical protein
MICKEYRDEIVSEHDLPSQKQYQILLESLARGNKDRANRMHVIRNIFTELTPSSASNLLHNGLSSSSSVPELDRFFTVKVVDMLFVTSQPGINFKAFEFGVVRIVTYTSSTTLQKHRVFLPFIVGLIERGTVLNLVKSDVLAVPS